MKRIMTIQDISCIGKCSLTVALPIISAMGVETAIVPTAVLSTHTNFSNFTFRDLTEDMPSIKMYGLKKVLNLMPFTQDISERLNKLTLFLIILKHLIIRMVISL